MDQVAVRAVDIEHVEAGFVGAARCLTPMLHHLRDFGTRQHARRRIGVGRIDRARGDKLPVLPVVDLRRWLERRAAFPRTEAPRLAARMAKLDAWHRVMLPDEIDTALPPGNERIVPQAK